MLSAGHCQKCMIDKAHDRHEAGLQRDTMIGLVQWMCWHEWRGNWGWLVELRAKSETVVECFVDETDL